MLCLFFQQEDLSSPTREDGAYLEIQMVQEKLRAQHYASTKIFSYQIEGPHSFPVKETLMWEPSLIVRHSAVSVFELHEMRIYLNHLFK